MAIRHLADLPQRNLSPKPWEDIQPNFPWGDPEFSKRMLKEHLDPTHDLASRRPSLQSSQLAWVVESWFKPRGVKNVLDLTCGPGLWANALARLGYTVRGIDISPAAIDHARKVAREEGLSATFLQGDIREVAFGSGYDAVLWLYGEANTLKWEEFAIVILKISESLNPEGILILELSHPEGPLSEPQTAWQTEKEGGVFGDFPYLWLTESFWNPDERTGGQRHYVIDLLSFRVKEYGVSYQLYLGSDLELLLPICGLDIIGEFHSLTGQKGLSKPEWQVVVAKKKKGEDKK